MKKTVIFTLIICLFATAGNAQNYFSSLSRDSLKHLLLKAQEDTNKVGLYRILGFDYVWSYPDSAMLYTAPGLKLAKKLNYVKGQIALMQIYSEGLGLKGNYPQSLHVSLEQLKLAEKYNDPIAIGNALLTIGDSYSYAGDYKNSIVYYNKTKSVPIFFKSRAESVFSYIGQSYVSLNKLDSALVYTRRSYDLEMKRQGVHWAVPSIFMGMIFEKKGDYRRAIAYSREAIKISDFKNDLANIYFNLANIYQSTGKPDSSIYYARKSLDASLEGSLLEPIVSASSLLTSLYKSKHIADSALKYQDIMLKAKDSVSNREKIAQMQNFSFNEQMRQQSILEKQEQYQNRVKMYSLLAIVAVFVVLAVILWRNNQHKQKANEKIQKTLAELKATQTQLIQSEKMASLGELTAGIAHEIQNPLNFVNNFSEVNQEMLQELKAESKKPKAERDEDLEGGLINDLIENEEKISHHGKRADGIVKGMLEHSRTTTGQIEPTDLNKLADEYLRLAYHGFSAKNKSFDTGLITNFDKHLPLVNVIPQDIGRVLVNLFNNAFYAVNQKSKTVVDYQPEVSVTTSNHNGQVAIMVKDNGTGIPETVKEKIMQPFFTTKPTGEGTGLGLSLTYDMVVKGHGGSIQVNSVEGEGSEFVISLPVG